MTTESVLNEVKQTAITTFVSLIGQKNTFTRVKAEILRLEKTMPEATGEEKRHKFFAEVRVIFDDLVEPIAESVLRLLLELAVAYVKARVTI